MSVSVQLPKSVSSFGSDGVNYKPDEDGLFEVSDKIYKQLKEAYGDGCKVVLNLGQLQDNLDAANRQVAKTEAEYNLAKEAQKKAADAVAAFKAKRLEAQKDQKPQQSNSPSYKK